MNFEQNMLPYVTQQEDSIRALLVAAPSIGSEKDTTEVLSFNLKIGTHYSNLNKNDSALFYLNKAEEYIGSRQIYKAEFWNICHRKISLYHLLGRSSEGLNYGHSVLKMVKKGEADQSVLLGKARLLAGMSNFFISTKQFKIADAYINQMNGIITNQQDTMLQIVHAMQKGILLGEQTEEDLSASLLWFKKARTLSLAIGSDGQTLRACINIAVSYYKAGQLDTALATLQEGVRLAKVEHPYPVLAAYSTMGEIYFKQGNLDLARRYLDIAVAGALRFDLNEIALYANDFLYQIAKAEDKHKEALLYYERFQEIKNQLAGKELSRELSELEIRFQTVEKDKELIAKNLQLEQHQSRFKNYTILTIALLSLLLIVIGWLRIRNLKQGARISVMQQEQQIENLKAIISGEERERSRIAGDLHDGIGAQVAAIKMDVERIQHAGPAGIDLSSLKAGLDKTAMEIRAVSHNLMPNSLLQNSLKEALLSFCNKIAQNHAIDISVQYEEDVPDFKEDAKLTVYRVFQELLQNTIKHARASKAYIQVRKKGTAIKILVEDNGVGFKPNQAHEGLGLNNIRSRIKALDGQLEIDSGAGIGSTFFISFELCSLQ